METQYKPLEGETQVVKARYYKRCSVEDNTYNYKK